MWHSVTSANAFYSARVLRLLSASLITIPFTMLECAFDKYVRLLCTKWYAV